MKRFWIVAGALVVTLGALALAMLLGSATFDIKRYPQHHRRLAKVMLQQPTADRLTRGLADEGTTLLAVARTREDLERAAASLGGKKGPEIRDKGARNAETRVYQTADMLYFIYFDAGGVMRGFTLVSR